MPATRHSDEEYFLLSGEQDAEKSPTIVRSTSRRRHMMLTILYASSFALNALCVAYFIFVSPINTKYVVWKGDKKVWCESRTPRF